MNTLNINTGIQSFTLKSPITGEGVEVKFNPSDVLFISKIYDVFDGLEKKQATHKEQVQACGSDYKRLIEYCRTTNDEMRVLIDGVFNIPVCAVLYPDLSVYSMTDEGIPVWADLLLTIIDVCNDTSEEMHKKQAAKMKKYTDKYNKKFHK